MIKPQVGPSTSLGAWNEMGSQALYHAGGIGYLHQKVHATTLANYPQTESHKQPNGVVIHLEPDAITAHEAEKHGDPRLNKMLKSSEHQQSLKKMGLMDWLTDNPDRHNGNIMIKPDGSPIAIDHGRAFHNDRIHALGGETEYEHPKDKAWVDRVNKDPHAQKDEFEIFNGFNGNTLDGQIVHHSDATAYGGAPNEETWQWWDANKDKMIGAFKKHLSMIPDEKTRNKLSHSFNVRVDHLNDLRDAETDTPPDDGGYDDDGYGPPTGPTGSFGATVKDVARTRTRAAK